MIRLIQCDNGKILINGEQSYQLVKLAKGGSAEIFRGEPLSGPERKTLTFKFLHPELVQRKKTLAHFKEEGELMKLMDCPGIPKLEDYNFECTTPYLAYQFIEGISVLILLKSSFKEGVKPKIAIKLTQSLLKMLDYLYTMADPVAHGDISPDNLLLSSTGRLALIDYGCVRRICDTKAGAWLGKPSYMSPEQAKAMPWDQRSDMYQAGIVLFELLTGRKYNRGKSARECALISANPPEINFLKEIPDLPKNIYKFLKRILDKDLNQRFQTPSEALLLIESIISKNDYL